MNQNPNSFELARALVGKSLEKNDLAHVDYYVFKKVWIKITLIVKLNIVKFILLYLILL